METFSAQISPATNFLSSDERRICHSDWNVPASGAGFVTKFAVSKDYLKKFKVQNVGGSIHDELWVPAEQLDEFNDHIVGLIEVTQSF